MRQACALSGRSKPVRIRLTSHSGMPMKWQAWKADTAWGKAAGSASPGRHTHTDRLCQSDTHREQENRRMKGTENGRRWRGRERERDVGTNTWRHGVLRHSSKSRAKAVIVWRSDYHSVKVWLAFHPPLKQKTLAAYYQHKKYWFVFMASSLYYLRVCFAIQRKTND